jgi:phosphoribosyl 1,2-cyclic phosphate phosphodiesterase
VQLIFLGCGDEHGVPMVGCDCDVCRSALSEGSRNARSCSSVLLRYGPSYTERSVLIDAAPEFRIQATNLGLQHLDALLLTHTHDSHILGLSTLANAQRRAGRPLAVHAPAQVLEGVQERFGSLWTDKTYRRIWQPRPIGEAVELWGIEVHSLRVNHGIGGTAYGYVLSQGQRRLAYVSDMLRASDEVRQALSDLDLLVLGTSHYLESIDVWKRSVMDIMTALDLIREVAPRRAVLTHLSHTIDYESVSAGLPPEVCLAYDGLVLEVMT